MKRASRLLTYYRSRIWWITSRVVLLTIVLSAVGLLLLPKYTARTKLTLLPTRSEIGYASTRPEALGLSPAALLGQTHVEALMSRTLAEDVARTLQAEGGGSGEAGGLLANIRRWVIAPVIGSLHRGLTLLNTGRWEMPEPTTALAYVIQGRTEVQNLPGSFVFQVGVTWDDPDTAARVANLLTERYVQMTLQASREEMRTTREYIEARITETEGGLAALEEKIKGYRVEEGLYATSTDLELGLQELS
jgi:uncharacterized protein involved in exopolysaccharide biosynthesis